MRCEGYIKQGTMSLGGSTQWIQCSSEAKYLITVKQEKVETLPSCQNCLEESKKFGLYLSHKEIKN